VGACRGSQEIMQMVAPAGPMYQAGTLSGNPLAMTAGIKTLERLSSPGRTSTWTASQGGSSTACWRPAGTEKRD